MKLLVVIAISFATPVSAETFDGTWKVPDTQKQTPAKCKAGDVKECLRLAWSAEAGIQSPGETDLKRLEHARDWHQQACTIAKQKPCVNADRVAKKLETWKALKTDAERQSFACADALDGAKRFVDGSQTAPMIVSSGCRSVLPKSFESAVGAVSMASPDLKGPMLIFALVERVCPTLKSQPAACSRPKDVEKLSAAAARTLVAQILKAALPSDLAGRADELAGWYLH